MRKLALLLGWSSQGNQDAAPLGWPATSAPLVSSSKPTEPHRDRSGRGLPAYRTSIFRAAPAGSAAASVTCSLSCEVRNDSGRLPFTDTFDTDSACDRSRLN